jgi:hypothetical protein
MTRLLVLTTSILLISTCLHAGDLRILDGRDLRVIYEGRHDSSAHEVARIYPFVKARLERVFGWDAPSKPSVIVIMNAARFQRMAENPFCVAFAVPHKNLMVIHYSRVNTRPFSMENTLKHELCHLLLHHHIRKGLLPRWLDEGVCQWVSDGIGEILIDQKTSLLNKAAFRGRFVPLYELKDAFPRHRELMMLAYEESRSFVNHVIARYGKEGLLRVLGSLKEGNTIETAFLKSLSIPLEKLEKDWHQSLRKKVTWFTYLSYHLYEILFALMAFITIAAFIKMILKKRGYLKKEEESGFDC